MTRVVVEAEVDIKRSPEDVFDYCSDPSHEPEWNPMMKRIEKITDGPVGVGTRFTTEFAKGPSMVMECIRYASGCMVLQGRFTCPKGRQRGPCPAHLGRRSPRDADATGTARPVQTGGPAAPSSRHVDVPARPGQHQSPTRSGRAGCPRKTRGTVDLEVAPRGSGRPNHCGLTPPPNRQKRTRHSLGC
jgi:hypothetical protein